MVFDLNRYNLLGCLWKKPEKKIYYRFFCPYRGFKTKKGHNLQFICNANKIILAWKDVQKGRKCVETEGLRSKTTLFAIFHVNHRRDEIV